MKVGGAGLRATQVRLCLLLARNVRGDSGPAEVARAEAAAAQAFLTPLAEGPVKPRRLGRH